MYVYIFFNWLNCVLSSDFKKLMHEIVFYVIILVTNYYMQMSIKPTCLIFLIYRNDCLN